MNIFWTVGSLNIWINSVAKVRKCKHEIIMNDKFIERL